jgi:two-component system cell cycle sensor histidine kinase/response regulator CckA
VRSLASRILKRHGYKVVEARRGADALALCEQGEPAIDLLVTDVIMPGMSGPELVDRLSRTRPDLRVLYISGYADVSLPELRAGGTQRLWLQKPFTAGDLASSVRRLLDG